MYNVVMFIGSILIPLFVIKKSIRKPESWKDFIKDNKFQLIAYGLLVLGFMVRTIGINTYPIGFGGDEASAGYEAYSLLNWGVDRHLKSFPVHFISWGSGQNVLYTYLCIPFVWLMGLSKLSIRIPMAMIGCMTLLFIYYFTKKYTNSKFTLVFLFLVTICPWHIMKSRWAIESNIFPDLLLMASMLIFHGLESNKKISLILGFILIGISAYSYGTSYFFIPIYVLLLLSYLIVKKKITIKKSVCLIGILGAFAIPLILFITINQLNLPEIQLGWMTIPRLTANRYQSISSVFSENFFVQSISNFLRGINILWLEDDGILSNRIMPYGILYRTAFILAIVGVCTSCSNKKQKNNKLNYIFGTWLGAGLIFLFVCEPNINRINLMIFPMIYYSAIALDAIIGKIDKSKYVLVTLYSIGFLLFLLSYFNISSIQPVYFENQIEEMIEYVSGINDKEIYVTNTIKDTYIYFLFYGKDTPMEFNNTVEYATQGANFEVVKSYGKYRFYIPDELKNEKDKMYVLPRENNLEINNEEWKTTYFDRFIVIEGSK